MTVTADSGLAPDPSCPHCRTPLELDCLVRPGGERQLLWQPCCHAAREHVDKLGWADVYGETFKQSCARQLGI